MARRRSVVGLALAVFLLAPAVAQAESAATLNARGFKLYQQQKYAKAKALFEEALAADDNYALAHYNLACTLGVLRKQGKVCDHDAYRGTILEHLERAVKLDPKRRERMKTDADLKPVHDTVGYQLLLGLSPKKTNDLIKILARVTWYGPSPGAYGPTGGVDFRYGGKLTMWRRDPATFKAIKLKGSYKVKGTTIEVRFKEGKKTQTCTGRYQDGGLTIPCLGGPFTDDPDDCSA